MSDFEQPVQPMSRAEAILRKYGDVTPMSRVEDLLKELVDESGGSDVTVTPVLSDGVRLATIGVDGTDYNIYAPEDVVGSIVSVTTEYNTGTLLATITVNDVEHYIYVPDLYTAGDGINIANGVISSTVSAGASYGYTDPNANFGADKDIYIKYIGDNVISEWINGGSFKPPTQHATYDIENSFGRDISNDYEIKIINVTIGSWTILVSDITTSWTIKDGSWDTGFSGIRINPSTNRYELHTNYSTQHTLQYKTNDFKPISIDSVWHKTDETWHKENSSSVIANPEDVATGTLTKLSVDGDVYEIKSYQEITRAEYDGLPSSKLTDDILYCITDAGGGTGGSSEVNYSTEEQRIGTWIDGKPLYQKTLFFNNVEITTSNSTSEAVHGIDNIEMGWVEEALLKDTSGVNSWVSVRNSIAWTASSTMQPILWRVGNRSIYVHLYPANNSIAKNTARSFYITVRYIKTTD